MTPKADIRRQIRDRRRQLTPEWIRQMSDRVQQRFLLLDEWLAGRQICCYLAGPTEVQTDRILDAGWLAHKRIWAPAFHQSTGRYECARLARGEAIIPGPHHIPEPAAPAWGDPEAIDLVITPGLAFDPRGGRVGHGQGHYDLLLTSKPLRRAIKVGLAFAFQVVDAVPTAAYDIGMDMVVTENAVIRCRAKRNGHQDTRTQRNF